jgi:voltage-gated potassium channel
VNVRRRIVVAGCLLLALALIAIIGYRVIGGPSVTLLDAVYMVVITVTGVGYGEIIDSSHNPALRVFNILVVLSGVGLAVYAFSELTAFLVEGELRHLFRRKKMKRKVGELNQHVIVCGIGETGRHVVEELQKTGTPYVVVDLSDHVVNRIHEEQGGAFVGMLYVIGDATDERVLLEAGLDRAKGLISTLPGDKDNLVIAVVVRQKNPSIRIVSRCTDLRYAERMLKVGANATVSPNRIGALRLASEMLRPSVVSFLDLMLQEKSRTLRIEEINLDPGSSWIGRTIGDLDLGPRYDLLLLALKREGDPAAPSAFNPPSSATLSPDTVMILLGDIDNLRRAREDARR